MQIEAAAIQRLLETDYPLSGVLPPLAYPGGTYDAVTVQREATPVVTGLASSPKGSMPAEGPQELDLLRRLVSPPGGIWVCGCQSQGRLLVGESLDCHPKGDLQGDLQVGVRRITRGFVFFNWPVAQGTRHSGLLTVYPNACPFRLKDTPLAASAGGRRRAQGSAKRSP